MKSKDKKTTLKFKLNETRKEKDELREPLTFYVSLGAFLGEGLK